MWSDPVRYINDETSPVNRNTLALMPPAAALEALAQPSLPDQEAMQLVHDMWCYPGNDKMEQIFKARRGRGFPRGFITSFANFIVPLARCRSEHVAIAVPSVSKWPQPSASKWPPPSERRKLTRCENAPANRRRKSKTLVQLSSTVAPTTAPTPVSCTVAPTTVRTPVCKRDTRTSTELRSFLGPPGATAMKRWL